MDKFPIFIVAVAKEVLSIVNEVSGDVQEVVAPTQAYLGELVFLPPHKRLLN